MEYRYLRLSLLETFAQSLQKRSAKKLALACVKQEVEGETDPN